MCRIGSELGCDANSMFVRRRFVPDGPQRSETSVGSLSRSHQLYNLCRECSDILSFIQRGLR